MSDDLNPDARRLVELARAGRTPGPDDKLRVAERLAVPLAAGAAASTAASAAKAATTAKGGALLGSWGAKVALVLALGAVGTALLARGPQPAEPTRAASPAPSPNPAPAQAPPAPRSPEQPALPQPWRPEEPLAKPEPPRRDPAHATRAPASGAASTTPSDELAEEAALLHRAQAAWRGGQSAQALELANQHAQRFPRSQLANERDVLRVLSLCKLGQTQAAKQMGARLLKKAKGSPWYQSVAESCAAR